MLITNGDRLKHHFQTTIAVKLFTVPEILTIINTFSVDIPKETEMVIPVNDNDIVHVTLESFMDFKTSKISEAESEDKKVPHLPLVETTIPPWPFKAKTEPFISEAESEVHENDLHN